MKSTHNYKKKKKKTDKLLLPTTLGTFLHETELDCFGSSLNEVQFGGEVTNKLLKYKF